MNETNLYQQRSLTLYKDGQMHTVIDTVVNEVSLSILFNDSKLPPLSCSPAAYKELAVGHLLDAGILNLNSVIKEIIYKDEEKQVWINTDTENTNPFPTLNQTQALTPFSADTIFKLINALDKYSDTFRITGGVHTVALGSHSEIISIYEDVGRHNAVDKVLGHTFLNRIPTSDKCLILSGRIAGEIVSKASHIGIPIIISRSAVSSKAIELAEKLDITIAGFTRGSRFNIYTYPKRIIP